MLLAAVGGLFLILCFSPAWTLHLIATVGVSVLKPECKVALSPCLFFFFSFLSVHLVRKAGQWFINKTYWVINDQCFTPSHMNKSVIFKSSLMLLQWTVMICSALSVILPLELCKHWRPLCAFLLWWCEACKISDDIDPYTSGSLPAILISSLQVAPWYELIV